MTRDLQAKVPVVLWVVGLAAWLAGACATTTPTGPTATPAAVAAPGPASGEPSAPGAPTGRPVGADAAAGYYRTQAAVIARETIADLAAIDFVRLRRGRLYFGESAVAETLGKPLSAAFQREEHPVVLGITAKILADDQTDTRAHMLRAISLRKLGRLPEADFHRQVAMALISSVLGSGDGKGRATAWKVFQVKEEYEIAKVLGGVVQKQSLDASTGQSFDVLDIKMLKSGETKPFFFEITELFTENGRRLMAQ
jgi:hypothetical protein